MIGHRFRLVGPITDSDRRAVMVGAAMLIATAITATAIGLDRTTIVVAIITAGPATIAALAAWRQARGANAAVNNAPEGSPTLRALVEQIATATNGTREHLDDLSQTMTDHIADHARGDL